MRILSETEKVMVFIIIKVISEAAGSVPIEVAEAEGVEEALMAQSPSEEDVAQGEALMIEAGVEATGG